MTTTLISLIQTTLIALRLQAASQTKCMSTGDFVVVFKAAELDKILKDLITWVGQLECEHAEGTNGSHH